MIYRFMLLSCLFLFGLNGTAIAEEPIKVSDVHLQLAERHLQAGHPFWAVHSYRRALETGANNPNIHRNLSQVLYDLGFVDEAISEMDQALAMAPEEDFLHMELGIFCLAGGRLQRAKGEFSRVLELNPGFSYGYYYLGEVFYRLGDYNLASMALVMSQRLGLPGFDLERKLTDQGWQLPAKPWRDDLDLYHLRRITVDERSTAEEVVQRLDEGELFEELARQFSTGPEAQSGGYVGGIAPSNMPMVFAVKLAGVESFSPPLLLESGDSFHVVQRIAPFDPELWQQKIKDEKSVRRQKIVEHASAAVVVQKGYLLLSGVFRNHDYADQRVSRLLKLGMKSFLQQRGEGEHRRYEVIAGRFDQFEAAEAAGAQLKQAGLDYYIRKEK